MDKRITNESRRFLKEISNYQAQFDASCIADGLDITSRSYTVKNDFFRRVYAKHIRDKSFAFMDDGIIDNLAINIRA